LSADNVAFLVDTKLRPAGLIRSAQGEPDVPAHRADPLLALRYRAAVIPPAAVRAGARMLRPLFTPFAVGAALSWLIALDLWLARHGLGSAVRQLIAHPVLLLALLGLVIVSAVWHEFGHAAACTYSGATPGAMGAGLYVIWPAFYTDVTDAYRLRRSGRLRTDLGGVYFNALFAIAAGGAYFVTHFEPLLALVVAQHFQIVQQLTPLMRLDGYYVVTDLVGVPDILSRLKPLLLSFLPFRAPHPRVTELKRWVRAATSAYILLFIAALVTLLVLLGLSAPHFVPAAVHSAELYSRRATAAWHRHDLAAAVLAEIQVLTVMLPAVGLALGVIRLLRGVARRMTGSIDRRLRLVLGMTVAALVGFGWPFLLWGLRPDQQTRPARASVQRAGHRPASATRHHPKGRQPSRGLSTTSKAPPSPVRSPSPSTASAPVTSMPASAPAGTTSQTGSTATANRAPAATAASPPHATSSTTSTAPSATTGGTSSSSSSTTTTDAGSPTTTIPDTTSQTTTGTPTTPTDQTTTTTASG
jgi:putative peptide zinc metalloprotease protein